MIRAKFAPRFPIQTENHFLSMLAALVVATAILPAGVRAEPKFVMCDRWRQRPAPSMPPEHAIAPGEDRVDADPNIHLALEVLEEPE